MATASLAAPSDASSYRNAAFEKVEIDLTTPPKPPTSTKFDPSKHLCFSPPSEFITLQELLLSEENAISPIAVTAPFPLFTLEGVTAIRADIFRKEIVEKHGDRTKPGCYKMRGYSKDTPFVDSVWRNEEVLRACSEAAGVDLAVMFDYEIGHVNVQLDGLEEGGGIGDVLPPAVPPRQAECGVKKRRGEEEEELASVGNWHTDSYPWVCVCMLSDPTSMTGGETGLRKGDGSILKVRGPGIGWAVMMQGGCINHIALKASGTGERVTLVTSFRPKDPAAKDMSNLINVKRSSRWDELFQQWTMYRLDVLAKRAEAFREELGRGGLEAKEIRERLGRWNEEQMKYLKWTEDEMKGNGREGSQY
jgi:hypothetical protein